MHISEIKKHLGGHQPWRGNVNCLHLRDCICRHPEMPKVLRVFTRHCIRTSTMKCALQEKHAKPQATPSPPLPSKSIGEIHVKLAVDPIEIDSEKSNEFLEAVEKAVANRMNKGVGLATCLDARYERRK